MIGILLEYIECENNTNGLQSFAGCIVFNILMFKIFAWLFQDGEFRASYANVSSHIIPIVLFIVLFKLEENSPKFYEKFLTFVYTSGKILLPLYLVHVGCGITVMYHMSMAGCTPYLTLLGGVVASFAVAYIIYLLVMKPSTRLMKKMIAKMRG